MASSSLQKSKERLKAEEAKATSLHKNCLPHHHMVTWMRHDVLDKTNLTICTFAKHAHFGELIQLNLPSTMMLLAACAKSLCLAIALHAIPTLNVWPYGAQAARQATAKKQKRVVLEMQSGI